jgi:hypothetical protein
MVRTVWLAIIFLAIMGAAAAVRVFPNAAVATGFANASANVASVMPGDIDRAPAGLIPAPSDINSQTDTLGKTDKLLVMRPAEQASVGALVEPTKLVRPKSPKSADLRLASRHWHDPLAVDSAAKSHEQRQAITKKRENKVPAAPVAEAPSCTEGAALLRKLKLLPDCQSVAVNADASQR